MAREGENLEMCDIVDLEDPFDTTYYRRGKAYNRDFRQFVGVRVTLDIFFSFCQKIRFWSCNHLAMGKGEAGIRFNTRHARRADFYFEAQTCESAGANKHSPSCVYIKSLLNYLKDGRTYIRTHTGTFSVTNK